MKLYVLPTEKVCNAHCQFCITDFRKTGEKEFLGISSLEAVLGSIKPQKIEITGGGEPTLNPDISTIINLCVDCAETSMYSHGANLNRVSSLERLSTLCISLAHHNRERNEEIMGVYPDLELLRKLKTPIKFSLLLHSSGISDIEEVVEYLDWAKDLAKKVVLRQMFDQSYSGNLSREFVPSQALFEKMAVKDYTLTEQGNPVFRYKGIEVEVEYRSCACEMDNPVLHADGNIRKGWD